MSYFTYIMASKRYGTLYVGVTNDIMKRAYEHREGLVVGFTKRYAVKMLVYFEMHEEITEAIRREKSIKRWSRKMKIEMIQQMNPQWNDLYFTLF